MLLVCHTDPTGFQTSFLFISVSRSLFFKCVFIIQVFEVRHCSIDNFLSILISLYGDVASTLKLKSYLCRTYIRKYRFVYLDKNYSNSCTVKSDYQVFTVHGYIFYAKYYVVTWGDGKNNYNVGENIEKEGKKNGENCIKNGEKSCYISPLSCSHEIA